MGHTENKIENSLKAALENGLLEDAKDINIRVTPQVVELSGFVDVLYNKNKAEKIAENLLVHHKVENHITLSYKGSKSDKDMEEDINKKLRTSNSRDDLKGVTAHVEAGTAVLNGTLDTESLRKQALELASKAEGVVNVVNTMALGSSSNDVEIANEINRYFIDSFIDVQDVSSVVQDGIVRLQGYVNNSAEGRTLKAIVEEIDGVHKVISNLNIRDWSLE